MRIQEGNPSDIVLPASASTRSSPRLKSILGDAATTASPQVDEPKFRRLHALITGFGYMEAGLMGCVSLLLGASGPAHEQAEWCIAVFSIALGVLVMRFGRSIPIGGAKDQILICVGTMLVTLAVIFAGRPESAVDTSLIYFLPALGCACLFSWVKAIPQLVFIEVCSVFAFAQSGIKESDVIIEQLILFTTAFTVAWLARAAAAGECDSLTGLANRRKFDRRLSDAIERAERTGQSLSVVLLDLDDFKDVNDTYGHAAGDRLLISVSRIWRQQLSSGQLLCRQGGDEFALILPNFSAVEAARLGDRLRAAVEGEIHCSVGVAELRGNDSRTKLLRRADLAMYDSKGGGGARTTRRDADAVAGDMGMSHAS